MSETIEVDLDFICADCDYPLETIYKKPRGTVYVVTCKWCLEEAKKEAQ